MDTYCIICKSNTANEIPSVRKTQYSACGPFAKGPERIQTFRETGNLKHLHRNKLDKACFAHDAAYSDSKDIVKRTISDIILKDIAYEIPRNC